MTQPWLPLANPGGSNRRAMRTLLKNWIDAQHIGGVDNVYPGEPFEWKYDDYRRSGADFGCLIGVIIERDTETRLADTGPVDPGGKLVHWEVSLEVRHLVYDPSASDAGMGGEDDFDRVVDALKDCLRGRGRDLGRPEVVLEVGEYPREGGIQTEYEPLAWDGGSVERVARVSFRATQYLVSGNDPSH